MGSLTMHHPFDPLTAEEIRQAASIVRPHFGGHEPNFRVITLQEPPKELMLKYLASQHEGRSSHSDRPARCARVEVIIQDGGNQLFDILVSLDDGKVVAKQHQQGKHSYIDTDYMKQVEAACMADPRVQAEIETLDIPPGSSVVVEPWAYATDGMNDMTRRISMCWFYLRNGEHKDTNFYAYPLDVCAEVSEELKVTKVYRLPTTPEERVHETSTPFDRRRIHSASASEYHSDLRPPPRSSTKPLRVEQSEGPSFNVRGQHIEWEKWSFRVGFNYREGLTLHDIRFDGRSMFYRLSLAEMFVPYGDPRQPYPRKGAFDLGNDGAGLNANNLRLGCDCLGTIKYFDGWHNHPDGSPMKLPNAICCHEIDDGILWKHTNFRTENPVVTRSRVLVLQTIITVTNYEYIFAFHFTQDAGLSFEVRATGILSTAPASLDYEGTFPYGTLVAPGVMAPYHQHLFSLRIDPALDGQNNSLVIEESKTMAYSNPAVHNPFGVGYMTESEVVEEEGGFDLDHTKGRTFKVVNENVINPITKTPVGIKLLPSYSQMLLAHPESFHARRSEFGQHAIWVTRYEDNDYFPAGRYTMQSGGGDGIASAIKRRKESGSSRSIRNSDIVIWHSFGSTHNPRIEDWPVMPCEKMTVGLKPVNFFQGNPAMDVAVSKQEQNQSVLYEGTNGATTGAAPSH